MMLLVILLNLCCLTFANRFHKHPSVLLLDVGNLNFEEHTTNQIRITAPGGNIAIRYPAIGIGNEIAHIDVCANDIWTDVKANIVEGGPGSNYVVLTLMGNEGIAFDVVITVQTVPSDIISNLQIVSDDVEEVDEIDTGNELKNSAKKEYHKSEINDKYGAGYLSDNELSTDTSQVNDSEEAVQEPSNINDNVENNKSKIHVDINVDQNDGDLQTDHQDEPSYIKKYDIPVDYDTAEVESLNAVNNNGSEDSSYIKQSEADKYMHINDSSSNVKVLDKELLKQYLILKSRLFGTSTVPPVQNEFEGNSREDNDYNNFVDRNGYLAVPY